MTDMENKVEETVEEAEASTEEKKGKAKAKGKGKGVDLNDMAAKGKEGFSKGSAFIEKLYSGDIKKGILISQLLPVAMTVLSAAVDFNLIAFALLAIMAAANYIGLETLKKNLLPSEEEAPQE